jgi:Homeodomain-like domain
MKRVEIKLKDDERQQLEAMCSSGAAPVRALQRAQILLALHKGITDQQITAVLNVERTRIWRVRQRYIEQGVAGALYDQPRSGRPLKQRSKATTELVVTADMTPEDYRCWCLPLLIEVVRQHSHLLKTAMTAAEGYLATSALAEPRVHQKADRGTQGAMAHHQSPINRSMDDDLVPAFDV